MHADSHEACEKLCSADPVLDPAYLHGILRLSEDQRIHSANLTDTRETNTARAIKASVMVEQDGALAETRLFIKTGKRNPGENAYQSMSMKEASFYRLIREQGTPHLPLPACYDANVSEETQEFMIVLEDLSERYAPPGQAALADPDVWGSCAESLARLHAAFWGLSSLPQWGAKKTKHDSEADRQCLRSFLRDFAAVFDARTKAALINAMEINIALIGESMQRIRDGRNATLCNGDSHIHNFMLPTGGGERPMIVDFQFWGEGIGTGDLAHLTRVDFPDALKRNAQRALVERYHQALLRFGVTGYSWAVCWRDYRISVASMVLIPLWQYANFGLPYDEWKDDLLGLIDNYEIMGCDKLCPTE